MHRYEQKMTEQQFLRILTSSVCGIVLCLVGLVSTTWAWYSLEIECTNNVIQVGEFNAVVTLMQDDIPLIAADENAYDLDIGTYQVRIEGCEGNNSPGYCEILLFDEKLGQTVALYPEHDGGENLPTIDFELVLDEAAWLEFIPKMGMPGDDDLIGQGSRIDLSEEPMEPGEEEDAADLEEPTIDEDVPQPEQPLPTTVPSDEDPV